MVNQTIRKISNNLRNDSNMKGLTKYINTDSRHKLLFMPFSSIEIPFIDIGQELSKSIEFDVNNKRLSLIADEALEKIISYNIVNDKNIGKYVAIKNIGILFEPALKFDLRAKIDSWAKSFILIIDSNEGTVINNIFYLAGDLKNSYSINLTEISNKTIYNEI